ncbi:MAG: RsmE family RNA methyltransferase [Candidatus Thiodiazotropha sp.]
MRIPRFYTTQALAIDTHITLEQEPSHHLRHVLRLRTGDDVILFAGDGNEYTATLTQVAKHGAEARIGEPLKKRANRMDHWHKIVINACEQSGRCRLPLINNPMAIDRALKEQKSELALLLDHRNAQTLAQIKQPRSSVSILIGPEGGLSQEERDLAIQNGFQGLRLGPRIMRTETAPLATIAAIQTIWGDF